MDALAKKTRWVGPAKCVLLGMAALLTAGTAALADTTTLICHIDNPGLFGLFEDEPTTTIELNEAQGSVVVHLAAYHFTNPPDGLTGGTDGRGGGKARSIGPRPAIFGNDTITFSDGDGDYIINRLTGAFAYPHGMKWGTCQPGKKQFLTITVVRKISQPERTRCESQLNALCCCVGSRSACKRSSLRLERPGRSRQLGLDPLRRWLKFNRNIFQRKLDRHFPRAPWKGWRAILAIMGQAAVAGCGEDK